MKFNKTELIGIIAGIIITVIDLVFFMSDRLFMFLLAIALLVITAPFVIVIIGQSQKEQEISEKFLEFSRNLAESVVTGTPISRSIINISKKNYGALSPYIQKLANQISLGIPVSQALQTFANDVDNDVIRRAVALISEAEKAGGEIDYILESVAKSISEIEKLKKERRAAIFNLVIQGYIIFFIFIGIMLVMEYKILPLTYGSGIGSLTGETSVEGIPTAGASAQQLSPGQISNLFLYLLLTQGFFAGLTIGKLSEGTIRAGIKHSFALTIAAFLIYSGTKLLLG